MKTHNKGLGAKYTKMRLPVKLVYVEEQPDRSSAIKRELAIKKMGRQGKKKLIKGKRYTKKYVFENQKPGDP